MCLRNLANHGYKLSTSMGEEGSADYIWEEIDLLKITRIDHGIRFFR
jgi:adenosine deaminase